MFNTQKIKKVSEWFAVQGYKIGMRINADGKGEVIAWKENVERLLIVDEPSVAAHYVQACQ